MPSPIVQIRIPQELLDQAKAQAEAERRSLSAWVRLLIEDRLRAGAGSDPEGIWPENFWTRKHWEEASQNLKKASVSQQEENRSPKPGDERSNRSRRAGKVPDQPVPVKNRGGQNWTAQEPSRPIKKGKACKHVNKTRKVGRPFCTDCGEFV